MEDLVDLGAHLLVQLGDDPVDHRLVDPRGGHTGTDQLLDESLQPPLRHRESSRHWLHLGGQDDLVEQRATGLLRPCGRGCACFSISDIVFPPGRADRPDSRGDRSWDSLIRLPVLDSALGFEGPPPPREVRPPERARTAAQTNSLMILSRWAGSCSSVSIFFRKAGALAAALQRGESLAQFEKLVEFRNLAGHRGGLEIPQVLELELGAQLVALASAQSVLHVDGHPRLC